MAYATNTNLCYWHFSYLEEDIKKKRKEKKRKKNKKHLLQKCDTIILSFLTGLCNFGPTCMTMAVGMAEGGGTQNFWWVCNTQSFKSKVNRTDILT